MEPRTLIIVDDPGRRLRRITLNRPEKRNALNHPLRSQLLDALQEGDADRTSACRSSVAPARRSRAGYDLGGGNDGHDMPFYTAAGDGQWPRHETDSWMSIWDLAKPVIAQVHGYCLAGGSELATGCDLVYIAEDAQMGYPAVRFGVPDMHFHAWFLGMRTAMEMMVTGDSLTGVEAVEKGWANRAVPGRRARGRRCSTIAEPHRQDAARHGPAQQAGRAPRHGGHGPAHRHPGRHRAVRPRHPPAEHANFVGSIAAKGLTGALDRRDEHLRRLPHRRGPALGPTFAPLVELEVLGDVADDVGLEVAQATGRRGVDGEDGARPWRVPVLGRPVPVVADEPVEGEHLDRAHGGRDAVAGEVAGGDRGLEHLVHRPGLGVAEREVQVRRLGGGRVLEQLGHAGDAGVAPLGALARDRAGAPGGRSPGPTTPSWPSQDDDCPIHCGANGGVDRDARRSAAEVSSREPHEQHQVATGEVQGVDLVGEVRLAGRERDHLGELEVVGVGRGLEALEAGVAVGIVAHQRADVVVG